MAEYVYGIIDPASNPPTATGIAGAPLRVIGGDGAAALVSDVPDQEEVQLGREEMLAHSQVLEAALAGGTVLPMRFGVVMEPDDIRERLLSSHGEELRRQLRELAGKVELNVRVLYEEGPLMRELVASRPDIAELRERVHGRPEDATYYERIQLGELIAQGVEQQREADAQELLGELTKVSLAVEVSPPSHERMVLSASFLVARERMSEFDAVLERQAEARSGRMRFKLVGPLPPHSFVDLSQAV